MASVAHTLTPASGAAPSDVLDRADRADASDEPHDAQLFGEQTRIDRLSRIRQLVFGTMDGVFTPLGVASGVAGGTNSTYAVIVAGLAEAFAGALSMGTGEFISSRAEAQVQQTEIARELAAIHDEPARKRREMELLFEHDGVSPEDARLLTEKLAQHPELFGKTLVEKRLGLQASVSTVKIPAALTMGVSYIVGSIFPLIAYFFLPISQAFPVSLALTVVALVLVGLLRGRLANLNLWKSVIEVIVVGCVSALGGRLLGTYIPRLLGY